VQSVVADNHKADRTSSQSEKLDLHPTPSHLRSCCLKQSIRQPYQHRTTGDRHCEGRIPQPGRHMTRSLSLLLVTKDISAYRAAACLSTTTEGHMHYALPLQHTRHQVLPSFIEHQTPYRGGSSEQPLRSYSTTLFSHHQASMFSRASRRSRVINGSWSKSHLKLGYRCGIFGASCHTIRRPQQRTRSCRWKLLNVDLNVSSTLRRLGRANT
jgi:hypothetical protein